MIFEYEQDFRDRRRIRLYSFIATVVIMALAFTFLPKISFNVRVYELSDELKEILLTVVRPALPQRREIQQRRRTSRPRDNDPLLTQRKSRSQMQEQEIDLSGATLSIERRIPREARQDVNRSSQRVVRPDAAPKVDMETGEVSVEGAGELLVAPPSMIEAPDGGMRRERSAGEARIRGNGGPYLNVVDQKTGIRVDLSNANPIIEWISGHQKDIPLDLKQPEYFNWVPGDVTTFLEFTGKDGRTYTLYMLGRRGEEQTLKIFLRHGREGILLQDLGASGSIESFQAGSVAGSGDRLALEMRQLPVGDPRTEEFMSVFRQWWSSVQ